MTLLPEQLPVAVLPCCLSVIGLLHQPGEDPFTQLRQEKRDRIKQQSKQQAANIKQAVKTGGAAAVPATLRLAAALPGKGNAKPVKRKELRDEVRGWEEGFGAALLGRVVATCGLWYYVVLPGVC